MCFDKDIFDPNPFLEHFICPIGKQILEDPVKILCYNSNCGSHSYCRACIVTWLLNDERRRCPICKTELEFDIDKLPKDYITYNCINEFDVKCKNFHDNCQWKGKLKEMENHLKKCDFEEINCINRGCSERFLRSNLGLHLDQCPHYLIKCELCNENVKRVNVENHNISECQMKLVNCEYCQNILLRKDLDDHWKKDCLEYPIVCKNSDCQVSIKRKCQHVHDDICEFIKVSCLQCTEYILRKDISEHLIICPLSEKSCSHCKNIFKNKDIGEHEKICEEKLIDCEFKNISNCTVKYKIRDKESHLNEYRNLHIDNALKKMMKHQENMKYSTTTNKIPKKIIGQKLKIKAGYYTTFRMFGLECGVCVVRCPLVDKFSLKIITEDNIKVYFEFVINDTINEIEEEFSSSTKEKTINIYDTNNNKFSTLYNNNNELFITINKFKVKRLPEKNLSNVKFSRI